MDPRSFLTEHAHLSQAIADAVAIEQRLQREVDDGPAPGFQDARWLLTRQKETLQKLRNQLDRCAQRHREAVVMRTLELLRLRVPQDVRACEDVALTECGGAL